MINETALKDTLLALTELAKRQYEVALSSLVELSALRETVRGLDPTFDDMLTAKRQQALRDAEPSISEIVAILDELTRKLRAGSVC